MEIFAFLLSFVKDFHLIVMLEQKCVRRADSLPHEKNEILLKTAMSLLDHIRKNPKTNKNDNKGERKQNAIHFRIKVAQETISHAGMHLKDSRLSLGTSFSF